MALKTTAIEESAYSGEKSGDFWEGRHESTCKGREKATTLNP